MQPFVYISIYLDIYIKKIEKNERRRRKKI